MALIVNSGTDINWKKMPYHFLERQNFKKNMKSSFILRPGEVIELYFKDAI